MKYLDFDLQIERSGEMYRASVVNSPSGEAQCDFSSPISEQDLKIFRLETTRARGDLRRMEASGMRAARQFGEKLFLAVFGGDVRGCLLRSLDGLKPGEEGLRLRIHLSKAPELANLPWEYLYEPSTRRFFALSEETPIVRYLELAERIRPVKVRPPVRVLVVISSPKDVVQLDVDREWKKLSAALSRLTASGIVEMDRLEKPTFRLLLRSLRRKEYHIFHFVGHGQFDEYSQAGLLVFEDEDGQSDPITAQALGVLLRSERSLRLAVLNSCEGARASYDLMGGTAQTLVQQGIPAVIAMQSEISDRGAQSFAETFYEGLAGGCAVDEALADARKIMYGEGSVEWGSPVLYMRSQDGRVFDVGRMTVEVARREAEQAITLENWNLAVEKLKELLAIDPADAQAAERLTFAQQERAKTVPMPPVPPEPAPKPVPVPVPVRHQWFGPTLLLTLVFLANWIETTAETWIKTKYELGLASSNLIAYAFHGLEGDFSFEHHDLANPLAIYGYSISYFFLLPLLGVAVAVALARRKDPRAYRLLATAVGIDYLVSLPFFLFFPVPERWAYPDSGAILLSDLWSTKLINSIRPISGLDNCFPSSHVSLTVILIAFCYLFGLRFRMSAVCLGLTIILSTFALGIHWMPDIVSGVAVGVLSFSLAMAGIGRAVLSPGAQTLVGLKLAELQEAMKRLSSSVRPRKA